MGIRMLTGTALALTAGMVFGAGSIISSFKSPCFSPIGMCHHGGYLYHMDNNDGTIYQTTKAGSVVMSLAGPAGGIGVHFTGTHFWSTAFGPPGWAYYRTPGGSIVSFFHGPAEGYGITYDGTNLWYSSAYGGNYVWKLTTTGTVISSFPGPGGFNGGLDWDPRGYLWVADWPVLGAGVYRVTTTGSIVESYVGLPKSARPSGCAWDGSYIWYCNCTSKYVYQMDTVVTSVEPASVGRIKAVYR